MPIFQRKDRKNEWWVDVRINGRRIRRRAPTQSEEGARELELRLRRDAAQESEPDTLPMSGKTSFAEFAELWLTNYVLVANRASTIREKRSTLRTRLIPAFGHLPLDGITTNTVDAQVAAWMRSGVGLKRVNNISTTLRKALRCAVEWGLLPAAPIVRHHRYFPPVPQFLTRTESDRLLALMEPGFWKTFVLFLLSTGVRFGEAAALRWEDLELKTNRPAVTIRRSVCAGIISEPKTRQSRRVVALTRLLCTNGMQAPVPGACLLKRAHRAFDLGKLRDTLVERLRELPGKLADAARVLVSSRRREVPDAKVAFTEILRKAHLPLRHLEALELAYELEPNLKGTAFGISQAVTRAAQGMSPEERFLLEEAAGEYLAELSRSN